VPLDRGPFPGPPGVKFPMFFSPGVAVSARSNILTGKVDQFFSRIDGVGAITLLSDGYMALRLRVSPKLLWTGVLLGSRSPS